VEDVHAGVPFNLPALVGQELEFIADAVARGQLSGDGYYTRRCHALLEKATGAAAAYLTHSCTAALEMAAILADIGPGDEVIMPSYTFVSTANAVVLRGGVPVFVDIMPDTLNIDHNLIEAAISPKTKAICAVHYAGVPAEMDKIVAIAREHSLLVIEDAAQAIGSTYHGRPAGKLGDLAAFSFHETKNVISGEGGALLVADEKFIERAHIIRDKGTNRRAFYRGQTDKYSWVDIGSSFLPGELVAAYLYAQLLRQGSIISDRIRTWNRYRSELKQFENYNVRLPTVPSHVHYNGHMFYLLLPNAESRGKFISEMASHSIVAPFHYVPLHSSPAGLKNGRVRGSMANTDDLSGRLVRLPLFFNMQNQADRVIDVAKGIIRGLHL
jgi:dTDP-4-amino-4,6-dideoxygalactose transaminase